MLSQMLSLNLFFKLSLKLFVKLTLRYFLKLSLRLSLKFSFMFPLKMLTAKLFISTYIITSCSLKPQALSIKIFQAHTD